MRSIQSVKNKFYNTGDNENRKKIINKLYTFLDNPKYVNNKDDIQRTITELELVMVQEGIETFTIQDNFVVNPVNIETVPFSINLERLYGYVDSYIQYTDEYRKDKDICIVLDKIMAEWWIAKCIDGIEVGSGNESVDIVNGKRGFDVFAITIQDRCTLSGEKSIIQDFKNAGKQLDMLFEQKKYEEAIGLYVKTLHNKLQRAIRKYELEEIYYIGFISTKHEVYLACFVINVDKITKDVLKKGSHTTTSVYINNFLDNRIGETKLYKSKKRIELRFLSSNIQSFSMKLHPRS